MIFHTSLLSLFCDRLWPLCAFSPSKFCLPSTGVFTVFKCSRLHWKIFDVPVLATYKIHDSEVLDIVVEMYEAFYLRLITCYSWMKHLHVIHCEMKTICLAIACFCMVFSKHLRIQTINLIICSQSYTFFV